MNVALRCHTSQGRRAPRASLPAVPSDSRPRRSLDTPLLSRSPRAPGAYSASWRGPAPAPPWAPPPSASPWTRPVFILRWCRQGALRAATPDRRCRGGRRDGILCLAGCCAWQRETREKRGAGPVEFSAVRPLLRRRAGVGAHGRAALSSGVQRLKSELLPTAWRRRCPGVMGPRACGPGAASSPSGSPDCHSVTSALRKRVGVGIRRPELKSHVESG